MNKFGLSKQGGGALRGSGGSKNVAKDNGKKGGGDGGNDTNARLGRVETKCDRLGTRLDRVEVRLEHTATKEEMAELRVRVENCATKEDIANLRADLKIWVFKIVGASVFGNGGLFFLMDRFLL